MKRLGMLVICGLCLVGCANYIEEPIEDDVLVDATEDDLAEQERQAHIDEIRKSINGEQEEMTTEEYFEQQRQREHERNLEKAKEMREVNETLADILSGSRPSSSSQAPKEESVLDSIGKARGIEIKQGMTYENFLMVGDQDFFTLNSINELFGIKGKLVSEVGNIQTYQWTSGNKVVTIAFTNGIAGSKNQIGL